MPEPICDRCGSTEHDPKGSYSLGFNGRQIEFLPDGITIKAPIGMNAEVCPDCFRSFIEMTIEWWENPDKQEEPK